ncbi:MAG: hypothetical protein RLZZ230_692 [Candidatus Parcubacteria bacterium]|jgi:hypothetical protein
MSRITRVDVGDEVYHVLNRANARDATVSTDAAEGLSSEITIN